MKSAQEQLLFMTLLRKTAAAKTNCHPAATQASAQMIRAYNQDGEIMHALLSYMTGVLACGNEDAFTQHTCTGQEDMGVQGMRNSKPQAVAGLQCSCC